MDHCAASLTGNPSRRSVLAGCLSLAAVPVWGQAGSSASAPAGQRPLAIYPQGHFDGQSGIRFNFSYSLAMLKLALSKVGDPVSLVAEPTHLPQMRRFNAMRDEAAFDVFWGATSRTLEEELLPIRICLMKGLNGWRIPVVRASRLHLLARVLNLRDLLRYTAGQGYHWIDTDILEAAGIKVQRSYQLELLYGMLAANRYDYFPRGIQEVWGELDGPQGQGLAADPHLVIRYPNPHYLFVRRGRPELAAMIEQGLEIARRDGSFDDLFYRANLPALQRAKLTQRRIIDLPNPMLPPETPLNRKDLWFAVGDLRKR